MTKEHFEKSSIDPKLDQILIDMGILKYSGLRYSTYMPAVHIENLREAMSRYAAHQNKVLIDALKKIQDKIRIWEQDNGASNLSASIKEIVATALASYAASQETAIDKDPYMRGYTDGMNRKPEGQVTGKSAGVWVKCSKSFPEDPFEKIIRNQFTKKLILEQDVEEMHGEYFEMKDGTQLDYWNCEWLDESGEAGKQPEQQPADLRQWLEEFAESIGKGYEYLIDQNQWVFEEDGGRHQCDTDIIVADFLLANPFPGSAQSDVSGEQKKGGDHE